MTVNWQTLLRAMRAPLGVLVFAIAALLLPPQTKDMLAALGGVSPFAWSSWDLWTEAMCFQGALVLLSLNAWFWAKALVDADFLTDPPLPPRPPYTENELRAFKDVPAMMAILAAVIWAFPVFTQGSVIVNFVVGIAYAAIVYALSRTKWFGQRSQAELSKVEQHANRRALVRHRVKLLLDRLPGPRWLGVTLLALSLVAFVFGAVASFLPPSVAVEVRLSARVASFFPGPGAALVCLALVIAPLAFLTFIADGWPLVRTLRGSVARIGTVIVFFVSWWYFSTPVGWIKGFLIALGIAIVAWVARDRIRDLIGWPVRYLFSSHEQSIRALGDIKFGPERLPLLSFTCAALIAAQAFCNIHTVRVVEGDTTKVMQQSERKDLSEFFQRWVDNCSPAGGGPVRPIIVAISGGASRAAVWGASVLNKVEAASVADKGATVFAVSSVSGGSLGAAAYMGLMGTLKPEQLCASGGTTPDRRTKAAFLEQAPLGADALGPLLAGAILVDIPRTLLSSVAAAVRDFWNVQPRGGDRAEAIEHGFEQLWLKWPNHDDPIRTTFDKPFLSLFYDEGRNPRAGMPIWIANGTDSKTGGRLVTIPFKAARWPFPAAMDVLDTLGADVPISTAINNTARFPYLEPAGQLLPVSKGSQQASEESRLVQIIDGGYFENEGLQTALDLAKWLREQGANLKPQRTVEPIIVQATGDGEHQVTKQDIARCAEALEPVKPEKITQSRSPAALASKLIDGVSGQFLTPLLGLNSVRSGHSAVLLRLAAEKPACEKKDDKVVVVNFFHFYLPGLTKDDDVPLNWILSESTTKFIRGAINDEAIGNKDEGKKLTDTLAR